MKILVIEDEHRIANALKEGLEQESYAVDVAYDGEQGYLSASADNYDIILLDVMLPIMDGYTVSISTGVWFPSARNFLQTV
jgi:DNA-binding response OmpR family regulator